MVEDYNSKYSGEQIEQLLDQVASGNTGGGGGGGITVETDPIFSASPAASITEAKKTEWDNKVDKVDGKQLSTEDFTTILKQKLDGLSNVTIDSSVSSTSTNPVQNKVVKSYIDSNCNIPVSTTTLTSISLSPNRYYRWTNTPTSITITLATPSDSTILNNYMFEFTASSSGTTLTMPSSIKWMNGNTPTIEGGKTYQVSIINNLATVSKYG